MSRHRQVSLHHAFSDAVRVRPVHVARDGVFKHLVTHVALGGFGWKVLGAIMPLGARFVTELPTTRQANKQPI